MAISSSATGLRPGVCTSTTRPTNPYTGQIIFQTDTGTMHNWDGAAWQFLAPTQQRNLLYNGAMQVAQRSSSVASLTSGDYRTADRWFEQIQTQGTWTNSVEADAPTGSGFRRSLRMLCTTIDASPTGADEVCVDQRLEGQDLQSIRKGTSSAQQLTISFWVKANLTGTYIAMLYDLDNARFVSRSYTISSAATWEFKTITFPADTTGAFDNDNNGSLLVRFFLGAGTNYTSGTLQTTWGADTPANRAVGQVNLAATVNNYWQVTGVQLNVGAVAAPFEFKSFGQELRECQRYFSIVNGGGAMAGAVRNTTSAYCPYSFPVEMRVGPTAALLSGGGFVIMPADVGYAITSIGTFLASTRSIRIQTSIGTASLVAGHAVFIQCGTAATDGISLSSELL